MHSVPSADLGVVLRLFQQTRPGEVQQQASSIIDPAAAVKATQLLQHGRVAEQTITNIPQPALTTPLFGKMFWGSVARLRARQQIRALRFADFLAVWNVSEASTAELRGRGCLANINHTSGAVSQVQHT